MEDSEDDALLLVREIARGPYDVVSRRVETRTALVLAMNEEWDVVLCDAHLPELDAQAVLALFASARVDTPVIVVSGVIDEESSVAVLTRGARDFILKGRLSRLRPAIERELAHTKERRALRRSEEALAGVQKLEAMGRVAGGIVHDFNNVLAVIDVYTQLIEDHVPVEIGIAQDLAEIREASRRGSALVAKLLAFSRMQTLEPRIVDLHAVLTSLESSLRALVGDHIQLTMRFDADVSMVRVDPVHLDQVITNLVVNARDAMPMGGAIEVSTTPAHEGRAISIAVRDEGSGMDDETKARIFEPFFTTKAPGKGTGLGLSTAFGIVSQSGGTLSVESELCRGSTFVVTLPTVNVGVVSPRSTGVEQAS